MTREQERAAKAFSDVEKVKDLPEPEQKRYATVVYQTISLLHSAGLLQAIEFMCSLSNSEKREAGEKLLGSLAEQMERVDREVRDLSSLRKRARTANLPIYMLLSREMIATLVWYKRFVQSILKIDAAVVSNND